MSFPGLLAHALYTNSCNFYGAVLSCSHIEPVTVLKMSHDMTKPTKWVCAHQRLRSQADQSSLCTQWVAKDPSFLHADSKDWSVWADAQADPSLHWAHTHFVGFVMSRLNYWSGAWQNQLNDGCTKRRLESARASTQSDHWVAKDPMLLHADSEDWSDWADVSLLGTQVILWVLSCCGSIIKDCFIFKYRE